MNNTICIRNIQSLLLLNLEIVKTLGLQKLVAIVNILNDSVKFLSRKTQINFFAKFGGGRDGGKIHSWKGKNFLKISRSAKVILGNGRLCTPGVGLAAESTYLWVTRGLLR